MAYDAYTEDLSKFGMREISLLRDLLDAWLNSGLPDDFDDEGVRPAFNMNSGYVFLTNDEYQVCMEADGKLESFYTTPYDGHEGFYEDLLDEADESWDQEDIQYLRDLAESRGDEESIEKLDAFMSGLTSGDADIEESTRIKKTAVTAAYGGWNKFYGLPDVEFTVPNDTDDPTIYYNGKYYNYYDVEDMLWDWFKEDTGSSDENAFESWIFENSDYVYSVLEDLPPKSNPGRGVYRPESGSLRGSANSSSSAKRKFTITASAWKAPNGKKYGKQSGRFKNGYLFTKKELKQMVADGVAEDMAGTFDPQSMDYDVIGFSWDDTNGHKTGILIQDKDGKLYVGNTGDAQLAKW